MNRNLTVLQVSLCCVSLGKLDRKPTSLPIPSRNRQGDGAELIAPRNPVEEVLQGLWCEVLGLPQVSMRDDFFELGGHSLLVTKLVARIRRAFKADIDVVRIICCFSITAILLT